MATPNTGYGIGDVITLLWFRWRYPRWAGEVLEMVIKTVADRGLAADEFIDYMAGRVMRYAFFLDSDKEVYDQRIHQVDKKAAYQRHDDERPVSSAVLLGNRGHVDDSGCG